MAPASARTTPAVEAALRPVESLTRALAEDVPFSVLLLTDRDGLVRHAAGARWTERGYDVGAMRGRPLRDLLPLDMHELGATMIEDLPSDPRWRARPLREHQVVSSANVLLGAPHAPAGVLGAHARTRRSFGEQDLDFLTAVAHVLNGALEGLRTEERIRHDALHDALTGLPNRALLLERLCDAIARADTEGRSLALFFLDVDHLKVLNDRSGTTRATSCCARSARACAPCCARTT